MCRSIQTLRGAEPPATATEVEQAALQYVRKLSGYRTPSRSNTEVFDAAVAEIAQATQRLLDGLIAGPGTREVVPVQRRLAAARTAEPDTSGVT